MATRRKAGTARVTVYRNRGARKVTRTRAGRKSFWDGLFDLKYSTTPATAYKYPRRSHRGGRWKGFRYDMAAWTHGSGRIETVTRKRSGLWGPGKVLGIFKRGR